MSTTALSGAAYLSKRESLPVRVRLGDGVANKSPAFETPSGESVALSALAHNEVQVAAAPFQDVTAKGEYRKAYIVKWCVTRPKVLNDVKDKVALAAIGISH